jgi:hypothetical protein
MLSLDEKSSIFQRTGNVKVKFTIEQALRAHRRSRCIALFLLKLQC